MKGITTLLIAVIVAIVTFLIIMTTVIGTGQFAYQSGSAIGTGVPSIAIGAFFLI